MNQDIQGAGGALMELFVLSIIVELTLAPIFNWRVYQRHFDGSTYIHPLTLVVTFALLWSYGINPVQTLIDAFASDFSFGAGGSFASALLVMFGSQGVYRVFDRMRVQSRTRRNERAQEARQVE